MGVDHVAGTWLALARSAGDGTLYPPLFDGEHFGGTRFMPVPIVLHGGLGALLGDELVAGKLLAAVLFACLLALVVVVLRRERCPWPLALVLAGTLLVTGTGLVAGTGIRHDTLPVLLQLGALALVAGSTGRRALLAAGALCALALAAKLSAVWAPLAIAVWLGVRDRGRLASFGAAFLGSATLLLAAFEVLSRGRLGDNVVGLGSAGSRGFESLAWELDRLRFVLADGLGPARLLVAAALVVVGVAVWRRRPTLYDLALAWSAAVLAVVLADRGAFTNQLLDVQVLAIVVVGAAAARLPALHGTAVAVGVLAIGIAGYVDRVEPLAAARALVDRDTSSLPEAARRLRPGERVLSEDPFVPVSLGQRPVVLDPFMLWSLAREHPTWRDDLVRRIEAQEFDAVVLFFSPEERTESESVAFWYRAQHLGPELVDAIERRYRPTEQAGDRWILRPRP